MTRRALDATGCQIRLGDIVTFDGEEHTVDSIDENVVEAGGWALPGTSCRIVGSINVVKL